MEGSARLLGDRIQRVQDVHGQVACGLVSKLRVSLDGVLDEFKTLDVRRAENCWRSHRAVLFSRACSLVTELPDTYDVTPFRVTAGWYRCHAEDQTSSADSSSPSGAV